MSEFLDGSNPNKRRWHDAAAEQRGIYAALQWTGQGSNDPLNIAYGTAKSKPTKADVLKTWRERQNRGAAPVLLVVAYPASSPSRAVIMGPKGEDPPWADVDIGQAERIASAALNEPSRHAAERLLADKVSGELDETKGLTNKGLLATHELMEGVPKRSDWNVAGDQARTVIDRRDQELVRGLGFRITQTGSAAILTDATTEHQRAVAVFLGPNERPDVLSKRHGLQTPVTYALAQADKQNIRWVLTVRGGSLRLYSTATSGAAGQRGRTDTYVELDLALLPDEHAAYLQLLFSAHALAEGGSVDEIRQASRVFATKLAERLRGRVYDRVIPRLAYAVADSRPDLPLEDVYRTALTIMFRMLFIAYAEDQQLLPYELSGDSPYNDVALKTRAIRTSQMINEGRPLGFDNPFTAAVEPDDDSDQTNHWDNVANLFSAIREGNTGWGIPKYGGGLFATRAHANPAGPVIQDLRLTNGQFGPALTALLVDRTPEGDIGPIDFRSLSVREFGTIYEGLLESELTRADADLTLRKRGDLRIYEPASEEDDVIVREGHVYLRDSSGARKDSGSYFTRPFAVEHLLEHTLVPAIKEHLDSTREILEAGRETDAARRLFDFRVADIAMGSGHFLTAVVDIMEREISGFLADHNIPPVAAELAALKKAARSNLPETEEFGDIEPGALLRRLIARRCIYGVDINPISVELARVAMWIHTFVPGLPLSFLDHNLTAGNSLTGVGTESEILHAFNVDPEGPSQTFGDEPLRDMLRQAEPHLERLATVSDATIEDVEEARSADSAARAAVADLKKLCDLIALNRLDAADVPEVLDLSDIYKAVQNWTPTTQQRKLLEQLAPFHFPTAFPEVFTRERPGFDVLTGNPPYREPIIEELAFWARYEPGLNARPTEARNARIEELKQEHPLLRERYEIEVKATEALRQSLHAGPYPGMSTGDADLYKAFCWRFNDLCRSGGGLGLVLPRSVFATKGSTEWRAAFIPSSRTFVTTVRNTDEWVFSDVNPGYTFVFLAVTELNEGPGQIRLAGRYASYEEYESGMERSPVVIDADRLLERDDTLALPDLGSDAAADLFRLLVEHPTLGDEDRPDFWTRALTDFHATNDRKKTGILKNDGDTPVYNHRNVGHFTFDRAEGEYTTCDWDEAVAELRRRQRSGVKRSRSAFQPMFQEKGTDWLEDPDSVPVKSPRIAFRDVVHATNPRKVWAAVLPARTVLTNPAPYLVFPRGGLEDKAYLLGMMNSSVCDWYGHLFVGLHLNYFILYSLPIPYRDPRDRRCDRLIQLAASLAAGSGEGLGDWHRLTGANIDSASAIAELDAIASLLYGLEDHHLELVWGSPAEELDRPPLADVRRYREEWS